MAEKKRSWDVRIVFYVNEKERDLIDEKMKAAGIKNREAYLRKMSLGGYVIRLDLSSVNELVSLLRNATNNLNRIARRANETSNIYQDDIKDLQEHYDRLWEKADDISENSRKFKLSLFIVFLVQYRKKYRYQRNLSSIYQDHHTIFLLL